MWWIIIGFVVAGFVLAYIIEKDAENGIRF
jgi:hypothetical protein